MANSQKFLSELDKKLWTAADKLRSNLDAAVYKHAVLGLIFLKYVSDSFELRQNDIEVQLRDEDHDCFLDPAEAVSLLVEHPFEAFGNKATMIKRLKSLQRQSINQFRNHAL